jgi:hypothetical protein
VKTRKKKKKQSWLIFPIVYFSKTCEFEQNNIEIQNILNKILNPCVTQIISKYLFPNWDQFFYAFGFDFIFFRNKKIYRFHQINTGFTFESFPLQIIKKQTNRIQLNSINFDDENHEIYVKFKTNSPGVRISKNGYFERFFTFTFYELETLWGEETRMVLEYLFKYHPRFFTP